MDRCVIFSLLLAALGLAAACKQPEPSSLGSARGRVPAVGLLGKGVADFTGVAPRVDLLNVSWYYNWSPRATGSVVAQFVPMLWGDAISMTRCFSS